MRGDNVVVLLGDSIFQEDLSPFIDATRHQDKRAKILLKRPSLEDARRCGIAYVEDGKIIRVEEKPQVPGSDLVVTGCYSYDGRVFDFIRLLVPPRSR